MDRRVTHRNKFVQLFLCNILTNCVCVIFARHSIITFHRDFNFWINNEAGFVAFSRFQIEFIVHLFVRLNNGQNLLWGLRFLKHIKFNFVYIHVFLEDLIEAFQKDMYIDEVELNVLKKAQTPEQVLSIIQSYEQMYDKLDLKPREGDESGFIINPKVKITMESYNRVASEYHANTIGKNVAQKQLDEFISMGNPPVHNLDIGCGPGSATKYLTQKYSVTGIEIATKCV